MLTRKLFAAFVTTFICYFIVPFFFNDFTNFYFAIGLGVSIITVPILFTVGIFCSTIIELWTNHRIVAYVYHFVCGLLCVCLFLLCIEWEVELFFIYTFIAIVYVTIFFGSDYMFKYKFVR